MLVSLETPAGTEFRQTHRKKLIQMADLVAMLPNAELPDYLFLDLNRGSNSLAFRNWPRFLDKLVSVRSPGFLEVVKAYDYLLRMEPVTDPRMYVEALESFRVSDSDLKRILYKLSVLPAVKRTRVYDTLKAAFRGGVSCLVSAGEVSFDELREGMLEILRQTLGSDQEVAEHLYEDILNGTKYRDAIPWLRATNEDYVIVPMLAKSDRADLRRLALHAIESHPSPSHKRLLEQLLHESDTEVSSAARAVQIKLNNLANVPVETLKAR